MTIKPTTNSVTRLKAIAAADTLTPDEIKKLKVDITVLSKTLNPLVSNVEVVLLSLKSGNVKTATNNIDKGYKTSLASSAQHAKKLANDLLQELSLMTDDLDELRPAGR